jgi:hypothetical protein
VGEEVISVWVNGLNFGSIGDCPFVELVWAVLDLEGSRDLCVRLCDPLTFLSKALAAAV